MKEATSFDQVIRRQRMVRPPYVDRPVPREVVADVLRKARKAPSAGFTQGPVFVVLEGGQVREFFELWLPEDSGAGVDDLLPCPVVVLPCERPQAYLERYARPDKQQWGLGADLDAWPVPFWTVDTAFATMVALLAATAGGLGAWFFGIFKGEAELCRRLGIPEGVRPIGAFTIGYRRPDEPGGQRAAVARRIAAHRRPDEEIIRFGAW